MTSQDRIPARGGQTPEPEFWITRTADDRGWLLRMARCDKVYTLAEFDRCEDAIAALQHVLGQTRGYTRD